MPVTIKGKRFYTLEELRVGGVLDELYYTEAEVDSAIATHAALTATHGATGAVVGTTNTQTLTNKTLTTPTIGDLSNAQHDHSNAAGGSKLDHGLALDGLADDDHTQYLLATGARAGASSQRQAFTNGVEIGSIRPDTDSTTAVQIQDSGGTSVLNIDTTNDRVGIGTTSPSAPLDVTGNLRLGVAASGNNNILSRSDNATGNYRDLRLIGNDIAIRTATTNEGTSSQDAVMITHTSANVGIGTTSPSAKLQVNGGIAVVDGMTAPSTVSGYAQIYVDSSDGDLKVKFGDGTTKTIATDT
jgi:hypothetical protein